MAPPKNRAKPLSAMLFFGLFFGLPIEGVRRCQVNRRGRKWWLTDVASGERILRLPYQPYAMPGGEWYPEPANGRPR